jgi:hypothetical protein
VVRKAIFNFIQQNAFIFNGKVVDLGCGIMPYRDFIKENSKCTSYIGIDFESSLNGEYSLIKPDLFWNGIAEDGQANTSSGSLGCRYGNNVPFDPSLAQFQILSYSITIDGIKGSLEGSGSSISPAHLEILKSVSQGSVVIISTRVSGPYEGLVTSTFKI